MKRRRYRFFTVVATLRDWTERTIDLHRSEPAAVEAARSHIGADAGNKRRWIRCRVKPASFSRKGLLALAAEWGRLDAADGEPADPGDLPEPLRSSYLAGFKSN